MKITKEVTEEVANEVAKVSGKWAATILHIADRCGIDRNLFIKHCTSALVNANVTTDFTNLDISTLESEVTE